MTWKPNTGFRLVLGRDNGDRAVRQFRAAETSYANLCAARAAGREALAPYGAGRPWEWAMVVENEY